MIKKDDFLNNESIRIVSYNYEESNGFSQETAVESYKGKYKKHKFVINVEGQMYSLEFLYDHVVEKYAAIEDEWVETERTIVDEHKLIIKTFDENNIHQSITKNILSITNYDKDIEEFKNKLIKTAQNLGIGCRCSEHYNREDDFANTYPNVEFRAPSTISSDRLYIDENEKELFNEYLSLSTPEEEQSFLNSLEYKINKLKKLEEIKAKKEKELTVNKLLKEYYDLNKNNKSADSKKEEILKYISEIELEDSIRNEYHTNSYIYPAPQTHKPWDYPDFFDEFPEYKEDNEEQTFHSDEEQEYLRERSTIERFKFIKMYVENELNNDVIPTELKDTFDIKDTLTDTFNKTDKPNQKVEKRKRKRKFS